MCTSNRRSLRSPRAANDRRGFTLIEVVIALGLLIFGSLAAARMMTVLSTSTQRVSVTTDAVALSNRLASELADAKFLRGDEDPGLALGVHATPAVGSAIQTVGHFPPGNPTLTIRYEVRGCERCKDPFSNGADGLDGVDVLITIDNYQGSLDRAHGLLKPMMVMLRREYPAAEAGAGNRGR